MRIIEVNQQEYKKTFAPNVLESGGLGPCVAVGAIYGRRGYMAHAVPGFILDYARRLLKDLQVDVERIDDLRIYVIGGNAYLSEGDQHSKEHYRRHVIQAREGVINLIKDSGFSSAVKLVKWSMPDQLQSLELILSEGRVVINEDDDPGFFELE